MEDLKGIDIEIATSDKFLKMPTEAQVLYFHLAMRTNEAELVEFYPVTKELNVGVENVELLANEGFIRILGNDTAQILT